MTRKTIPALAALTLLTLLGPGSGPACATAQDTLRPADSPPAPELRNTTEQDSVFRRFDDFDSLSATIMPVETDEKRVTPWGAIWRSLVLPGWGQYYVESYWKAPIALGAAGFFLYRVFNFNGQYLDRDDALSVADPDNEFLLARLRLEREFYRDKRDEAAFFLAVTYLITVLDAYVGAHLYDFDVSDDLSAGIRFIPGANTVSLSLRW